MQGGRSAEDGEVAVLPALAFVQAHFIASGEFGGPEEREARFKGPFRDAKICVLAWVHGYRGRGWAHSAVVG